MIGKKLVRQVTVFGSAEAIAVIITMLNQIAGYDVENVLRAVCAYFKLTVTK